MTTETVSPAASEPAAVPTTTPQPGGERLVSLDALRGFDMFWIVGGREFVMAMLTVLAAKNRLVSETAPLGSRN